MTRINTLPLTVRSLVSAALALGLMAALLASVGPLSQAVAAAPTVSHRVADIVFWEVNTNLPDGGADGFAHPAMTTDVLSVDEIYFLEMNHFLPNGDETAQPAAVGQVLTTDEIQFQEENIWEHESFAVPASNDALVPPTFILGEPS